MTERDQLEKPLTRPALSMFAPYRQTIIGFLIVGGLIGGLILLVQLLLWIK